MIDEGPTAKKIAKKSKKIVEKFGGNIKKVYLCSRISVAARVPQ